MTDTPDHPWIEPRPPPKKNIPWPYIVGPLIAAVVVAICVAKSSGSDGPRVGDAVVACKRFVEERLTAPATADFSGETVTGEGPFTVTGTVDAENAFGAKLRSTYTCVVRASGDTLVLDSLAGLN